MLNSLHPNQASRFITIGPLMDLKLRSISGYTETFWLVNAILAFFFYIFVYVLTAVFTLSLKSQRM